MKKFLSWLREDEGATAVEYAIMLTLIIAACLGAVRIFGQATSDSFASTTAEIQTYVAGS